MLSRLVFPASGAAGFPLNGEIRLTYRGGLKDDPSVVVRPAGGQPISLELRDGGPDNDGVFASYGKVVLAKPLADLLPNTTYEVLDRVVNGCRTDSGADAGACFLAEPAVVSTFVTGASRDDAPPTFGGVSAVNIGALQVCDQSSCCGPYSGFPVTLGWSPATDDHDAAFVRYNVYSHSSDAGATGVIVARFLNASQLHGGIICTPPPYASGVINGGLGIALKGTYAVHAVDAAGNEDQNSAEVEVEKMCTGAGDGGSLDAAEEPALDATVGPADSGSPPEQDASSSADVGSATPPIAPASESSGCSIARSRRVNYASAFGFVSILLASAARFRARAKGRRNRAQDAPRSISAASKRSAVA